MRSGLCRALIAVTSLVALAADAAPAGARTVEDAVERFGRALLARDAARLRDVLPAHGSVRLRLARLCPADGSFTAGQVESLLAGALERAAVRSFDTLRIEHDPEGLALARLRIELTDRDGREVEVEVRLRLHAEDGVWVLREIREAPA